MAHELLNPYVVLLMMFGCVMGIIFGAIPGLNADLAVTLVLPISFGMSTTSAFALLISAWVGGVSGSFIAAALIGIPGSTSSIATVYDAYPMCQKGQVVKALGAAIIGSFIGTFFSCIIACTLSPIIANLAIKLGPWEYFSLCLCAILLVITLSEADMFKGLAAAAIGLLISSVGYSPIDAYKRFTFGSINLLGGITIIALVLGLFAVRLITTNYGKGEQVLPDIDCKKLRGIGVTLKDFIDNAANIIRSFLIGLWIGFLPGMGSGLSNMVSYAFSKNSSKHPELYGTGIVDGIFASEVANNASVGGAVIPMVALGIPGDSVTALLLGGLIIHGIEAGPLLFNQHPEFVYTLFGAIIVSAIIVVVLELSTIRFFPRILMIPYHYLYSAILILCFVGAFTGTNTLYNCGLMLAIGAIGIGLDVFNIPVAPLLLSFILGPMVEKNLRKGLTYSNDGFITFLTRPVSLIFLLIAVACVIWPIIKSRQTKKKVVRAAAGTDIRE